MNQLRNNTLLKNGMLVFAAQMAVNVCNFGFHFVVSRRVGVVAYGTLNALVSGFQIFVVPSFIVTTVLVKYAGAFHARSENSRIKALLSRSMVILAAGAGAVFLAGLACSGAVAQFLHIPDRTPIVLMLAVLCLNFVLPVRGILQGREDFLPYSISLSVEAFVKMGLAIAFTWIGWGIAGALGAWTLGCAVALAYTWLAQWAPARREPAAPLGVELHEVARTSAGVTIAMLCVTSLGFSDVVLAKHYFDPTTAGLYGAAALCGKMLYFLVYFVPAVLLPRVVARSERGESSRTVLAGAFAVVALLGGGGAALYGFGGGFVVQALAGHAFAAAAPLVFPYGIAAMLLAALNTAVTYKIGVGRYGFLIPLVAISLAQIGAIVMFHSSAIQVIRILIACNLAGLAAVLLPLRSPSMSIAAPIPATQGGTYGE